MRRTRAFSLLAVAAAQLYSQTDNVPQYVQFGRKYRDDLAGFALDCIDWRGEEAAKYQIETWADLVHYKRESVRAPHGAGKSTIAAITVHWFALTRDTVSDWKAITTASGWRQLTKYLWPEIHKWAPRIKWDLVGRDPYSSRDELLSLSLKLKTGEAFAAASSRPEFMEGAHADSILYIFDESKAVPDETFDAAEGAFSTAGGVESATNQREHKREAYALAISTPGEPMGRFYDIQSQKPGYEDWNARHITLAETIAAGRLSEPWAEQRRLQWGENSAVYLNRVLGEFASSEEDTVVPHAWVEAAQERWLSWYEAREQTQPGSVEQLLCSKVSVDVAREGSDKTVIARRIDVDGYRVIMPMEKHAQEETMATTGRVLAAYRMNTTKQGVAPRVVVDVIGIGAGVVDRLRELDVEVGAYNASTKSYKRDRIGEFGFANKRAEAWWTFREQLDPAFGSNICLPPDDELLTELITPKWSVTSGANILVEPKEKIKKRLEGRSTDSADAVIQCFVDVPTYSDMMDALETMADELVA